LILVCKWKNKRSETLKSITGGEKKKTKENTEFIAITHLQTEKKGT
jgi:hypothetical protein